MKDRQDLSNLSAQARFRNAYMQHLNSTPDPKVLGFSNLYAKAAITLQPSAIVPAIIDELDRNSSPELQKDMHVSFAILNSIAARVCISLGIPYHHHDFITTLAEVHDATFRSETRHQTALAAIPTLITALVSAAVATLTTPPLSPSELSWAILGPSLCMFFAANTLLTLFPKAFTLTFHPRFHTKTVTIQANSPHRHLVRLFKADLYHPDAPDRFSRYAQKIADKVATRIAHSQGCYTEIRHIHVSGFPDAATFVAHSEADPIRTTPIVNFKADDLTGSDSGNPTSKLLASPTPAPQEHTPSKADCSSKY